MPWCGGSVPISCACCFCVPDAPSTPHTRSPTRNPPRIVLWWAFGSNGPPPVAWTSTTCWPGSGPSAPSAVRSSSQVSVVPSKWATPPPRSFPAHYGLGPPRSTRPFSVDALCVYVLCSAAGLLSQGYLECEYSQTLCCSSCHSGQLRMIPARYRHQPLIMGHTQHTI